MLAYYQITFILSVILSLIYVYKFHKHFEIYFTILYILIPLTNLAFLMQAQSTVLEEAILATKLTYVGGCFLQPIMTLFILEECHINVGKWLKHVLTIVMVLIYADVLFIDTRTEFYRSISIDKYRDVTIMVKEYGSVHTIFYVVSIGFLLANGILLIYSAKRKDVPLKSTSILLVNVILNILAYLLKREIGDGYLEMMPASFIISQISLIAITDKIGLYNVNDTVIENIIQNGTIGYINLDLKRRYLGGNAAALRYMPELAEVHIDKAVSEDNPQYSRINEWLNRVDTVKGPAEFRSGKDETLFKITADYLYDENKIRGYQIKIEDNTRQQQYINLINNYNSELEQAVKEKTAHLMEMHNKLVLGMADMVENRDANTGGHIKRTSNTVRILINEMCKDKELNLSAEFCEAVIKAAPMHDLGKIAVDDVILRKPGRFEPEEFEIMKSHAAKGGEIVRRILEGTDDKYFAEIAENIAHYHHERVDGSGYPEGLKGNEIPYEARIMAIADVYDALVSKRCYKDSMEYDKAFSIIEEGMGSQFDESLNKYFVAAREQLEIYYEAQKQL